jgi:hypothetical protein
MIMIKRLVYNLIKSLLLQICLYCFLTSTAFGFPEIIATSSRRLIESQCVFVGKVTSQSITGLETITDNDFRRGKHNVEVHILKATIEVEKTVKGADRNEIVIDGLIMPVDFVNNGYVALKHQLLVTNRNYVFFLSPSSRAFEFTPSSEIEFAVQIEQIPSHVTGSPEEILSYIAKVNVEATNYALAIRWARFLSEFNEDFAFWTTKTHDKRIMIRATAYETLLKSNQKFKEIRLDLIKCLSDPTSPEDDSDVQTAHLLLIPALLKLFVNEAPTVVELKALLASGDKNVLKAVLNYLGNQKNFSTAKDVVQLMSTSKDRDVQYACLKVISAFSGDQHLIAYPTFLNEPERHVQDYEKVYQGLSTNKMN